RYLDQSYQEFRGRDYVIGWMYIIPGVIIADILLQKIMKKLDYPVPPLLKKSKEFIEEEMPNFGLSLLIPLNPAILISISTILNMFVTEDTLLHEIVSFIGSAEISLIIAIIASVIVFA